MQRTRDIRVGPLFFTLTVGTGNGDTHSAMTDDALLIDEVNACLAGAARDLRHRLTMLETRHAEAAKAQETMDDAPSLSNPPIAR